MENNSEAIAIVRAQRKRRKMAADLLANAPRKNANNSPLGWDNMLDVPEWCYWQRPQLGQLVLAAGALYMAPTIQLWIEVQKVSAARNVLGPVLFQHIMTFKPASMAFNQNDEIQIRDDVDLKQSLYSIGSSVLLSSLPHQSLRDRLAFLVPEPAGKVSQSVADMIITEAITLIEKYKNSPNDSKENSQ